MPEAVAEPQANNAAGRAAMLSVRGLQAWYGESHILHGVDFDVRSGEVVTLLGRNGAGKTTTLRAIMGIVPRREGSIVFEGEETVKMPSNRIARRGIAFVPDGARCFANATVEENLRGAFEAVRPRAAAAERDRLFASAFELFPILRERRAQLAGSMSGGQRQMLAIARALMIEPRVLILDEPSAGLSPKLVEDLFEALGRISGIAIADTGTLPEGRRFDMRVRATVEIGEVPAAVRLLLFWRSWSRTTEWYAWKVRP